MRSNKSRINWSNPEEVRAYRRNRLEKETEFGKRWRAKNPEKHPEYQRRYAKKNPEKIKAQNLMNNNGKKFPLGSECEFCGATKKLEHGHIDYDYPEIYLTVCHKCNLWMGVA